MGILHLSTRYPHEISGGEKQRIAIARAFAPWPKIVLMDEPLASLDILTREYMQSWLLEFWSHHEVAVLFVTHDIEEALMLGDRLTIITGKKLHVEQDIPFSKPRNTEIKYTTKFLEMRNKVRLKIIS